jgi:uncharacterized protein (DUF362 family)/NAD-dependent dihydropyrimidine dehydrogenase PreA subunit
VTKSRVALVRCEDYGDGGVYEAVKRGIALLGGVSVFAMAAEKILLKPNMLIASAPDRCVTTHPSVFGAVAKVFKEAGASVSYGDSPSFGGLEMTSRACGIKAVAERLRVPQADFAHGREVSHREAIMVKRLTLANGVLDAGGVISLSKLKTHGLTRLTGAVKNQFGCVPGILKGQYHAKMADPDNFAVMLVDISTYVRPRLYVMDAVMAMEGNGPRNGRPRRMNALLFSTDPVALDAVACRMIDLDPEHVPTSRPGEQSGLGTYHAENIEILGDDVREFVLKDFDAVRQPPDRHSEGRLFMFIRNRLTPRPAIDPGKCTACGTCVKMCPIGPTALDWMKLEGGKRPRYNYGKCIRCYCCQETCPEGAIVIKRPLASRILFSR